MRARRRLWSRGPALTRRQFLVGSLGTATLLGPLGCSFESAGPEPTPPGPSGPPALPVRDVQTVQPSPPVPPVRTWLREARIAGFETYIDYPPLDLVAELDARAAAHVGVVVIDSDLSFYMDDTLFEENAAFIDHVARECHARGMKAVTYYPMLEALTEDAETTASTMFKDHPDWVQIGIDGQPNTFVGGEGRVFWVPPGCESTWLCPTSGYREYFLARVKRLAQTALDGLWGDVPLLSDIVGVWPCTNPTCAAKFLADTGLAQPAAVDWNDPTFRRWVAWRHQVIHEFEQAVDAAGRSVRPDFELIVETVTMDYTGGTVQGLDGAATNTGKVLRVWEIDAVSDDSGMRNASADDWISCAVMMRHAAGCSGQNPGWAITYGKQADDAERVMALAIAAGVSPYETKIPLLNATVGFDYRARMYGWLKQNEDVWDGLGTSAVAVLFSSLSRDFVDRNAGVGLYTSLNAADPLWWSTYAADSAKALPYLGEYRGLCKALIHAHAPYDLVPTALLAPGSLARYKLVVAPRPAALSQAEIAQLVAYVEAGGTLLVTGNDAGKYDEHGTERPQPALLGALGLGTGTGPAWTRITRGLGAVVYVEELVGSRYFDQSDATILVELGHVLDSAGRAFVTDAPLPVMFDLRLASYTQLNILCANIDGLDTGAFAPASSTFQIAVDLGGRVPIKVTLSEPGMPGAPSEVPFTKVGARIVFDVTMSALLLARIELV